MSCNNTNSTCTSCNYNYSSCNNKCTKCGCKDSFLTSPPPCPTPAGCPDPIPCQEILSSDCIIYNGPNISCNGDVIITSDSTWAEVLEDLVDYFCITYSNVPLISCGVIPVVTAGSSVNSALQQIVTYFCTAISGLATVTANNGLTKTANNIQLGGSLIQNTTLTNSTFTLKINSTTVPALSLERSTGTGFALEVNPMNSPSRGISSNSSDLSVNPLTAANQFTTGGSQALILSSSNNFEDNSTVPILATPIATIFAKSNPATSTNKNNLALRLVNENNKGVNSGISIEMANASNGSSGISVSHRLISKTVTTGAVNTQDVNFIIQGKNPASPVLSDLLTLLSTGQLQLNKYGTPNNFTGIPAWSLSADALGNVIQTTAGLFGTAFKASSPPLSRTFVTPSLANSEITNGVTIKPTSIYQIVNGVTVTTMYNVGTGVWTCPQTGKYDINYNVYLTTPSTDTFGWGDTAYTPTTGIGQFFIGVTNDGTTTYCADSAIIMNRQYLFHLYLTGGMQGVDITAGTTLVLKIQNMTGINYVSNSGDNIDWSIRRVG
jgi:hypothetical protein